MSLVAVSRTWQNLEPCRGKRLVCEAGRCNIVWGVRTCVNFTITMLPNIGNESMNAAFEENTSFDNDWQRHWISMSIVFLTFVFQDCKVSLCRFGLFPLGLVNLLGSEAESTKDKGCCWNCWSPCIGIWNIVKSNCGNSSEEIPSSNRSNVKIMRAVRKCLGDQVWTLSYTLWALNFKPVWTFCRVWQGTRLLGPWIAAFSLCGGRWLQMWLVFVFLFFFRVASVFHSELCGIYFFWRITSRTWERIDWYLISIWGYHSETWSW